jgi:hypothetical protein
VWNIEGGCYAVRAAEGAAISRTAATCYRLQVPHCQNAHTPGLPINPPLFAPSSTPLPPPPPPEMHRAAGQQRARDLPRHPLRHSPRERRGQARDAAGALRVERADREHARQVRGGRAHARLPGGFSGRPALLLQLQSLIAQSICQPPALPPPQPCPPPATPSPTSRTPVSPASGPTPATSSCCAATPSVRSHSAPRGVRAWWRRKPCHQGPRPAGQRAVAFAGGQPQKAHPLFFAPPPPRRAAAGVQADP